MVDTLTSLIDGLILAGDVTAEQVQSAAHTDTPYPALVDELTVKQIEDLTRRLETFKRNKAKVAGEAPDALPEEPF